MSENEHPESQSETAESIRLDNFLKLTGTVGTGGQAKLLIQAGEVLLNGEIETRRRKKLVAGDIVEVMGEIFEVEQDTGETDETQNA